MAAAIDDSVTQLRTARCSACQSHQPRPISLQGRQRDPIEPSPSGPPAHARSLLYQLSARDDDDCTSGTQFYRCGFNGFRGCCSVDPCDREDCPDSPTLPAVYVSSRIGHPTEPPTFVIPNMSATSEEITSTTTEAETTTSATSTTESDEGSDREEETSSEEPSTTTTTAVEESTTFSTSLRGATTETARTQTTSLGAVDITLGLEQQRSPTQMGVPLETIQACLKHRSEASSAVSYFCCSWS